MARNVAIESRLHSPRAGKGMYCSAKIRATKIGSPTTRDPCGDHEETNEEGSNDLRRRDAREPIPEAITTVRIARSAMLER
jgi:hypothetical protein